LKAALAPSLASYFERWFGSNSIDQPGMIG